MLINKVDTVTAAELSEVERRVAALNALARVRRTTYGDVAPLEILQSKLFVLEKHPRFAEGTHAALLQREE